MISYINEDTARAIIANVFLIPVVYGMATSIILSLAMYGIGKAFSLFHKIKF